MLSLIIGTMLALGEPVIIAPPEMVVATDPVTVAPTPADADLARRGAVAMPNQLAAARGWLDGYLNDYPSARFRNVRLGVQSRLVYVCGELNAKNSYGAYTGWTPFYIIPTRPGREVSVSGSKSFSLLLWERTCLDPGLAWVEGDAARELVYRP